MGLHQILVRGLGSALHEGEAELDAHVAQLGETPETAEHIRQTVEAMPGLLIAVDRALRMPEVPLFARTLYFVVMSYLLQDDDLIPMHEGRPVLGLLDDAYLLHRACQELRNHMTSVEMRSVDGGAALLARVLPEPVAAQLNAKIVDAVSEATRLSHPG